MRRAQRLQRQQVRVDPPTANAVAARQRHIAWPKRLSIGPAATGRPVLAEQLRTGPVEAGVACARATYAFVATVTPIFDQRQHRATSPIGQVVQGDSLIGEKGGRQNRQRCVLVAGRHDITGQGESAFDRRVFSIGVSPLILLRCPESSMDVPIPTPNCCAAFPLRTANSTPPSLPISPTSAPTAHVSIRAQQGRLVASDPATPATGCNPGAQGCWRSNSQSGRC